MLLIEIFLGIIAGSLIIAAIFFIIFLFSIKNTLNKANESIEEGKNQLYCISQKSTNLLDDTDDLILDLKRKSDSINFLFTPLERFNKSYNETKIKNYIYQIEELLTLGLFLFDKVKKSRK